MQEMKSTDNKKTKITVFIVIFIVIAAIITADCIKNIILQNEYNRKIDDGFNALFVTEREQVNILYNAIGNALKLQDSAVYDELFDITEETEELCMRTAGNNSDIVAVYGARLVYYGTFYRDIRQSVRGENTDDLKKIYDFYGEITALYDKHSENPDTEGKIAEMTEFYKSVSTLNEDMLELNKKLTF